MSVCPELLSLAYTDFVQLPQWIFFTEFLPVVWVIHTARDWYCFIYCPNSCDFQQPVSKQMPLASPPDPLAVPRCWASPCYGLSPVHLRLIVSQNLGLHHNSTFKPPDLRVAGIGVSSFTSSPCDWWLANQAHDNVSSSQWKSTRPTAAKEQKKLL